MPLHLNADIEASYRRFVERVADGGCWVLVDEDEHGAWVESDDAVGPDGEPLPVHLLFSDRAYAQRLARDEWKGYSVISLPPVLLEMVLVDLRDRGERVGCNFTADLAGVEIEPERLRRDLVARG